MSVFVDSSAWYAAADLSDRHHPRATRLLGARGPLVTSDQILVESWRLLHHRLSWQAAESFWAGLRAARVRVECTTPGDFEAAFAIGQRFADQHFSLVDRTSFSMMERLGLTRVISFNRDFAVYRYGRNRLAAFEVLR